ncbi:hypothetical protein RF11_02660 [Thelohanellus kitauei]|uniref:Uncharacterized protein n=1 Tax=Thelohanellus kitauei TaxID=669202 RepID=A0A0C2IMT7_THEKT|nr:hypothetical protein RF11_02660 [Thelohanellus kitauei]
MLAGRFNARLIAESFIILTFVGVYGCFFVMESYNKQHTIKFRFESKIAENINFNQKFQSNKKVFFWIHDKISIFFESLYYCCNFQSFDGVDNQTAIHKT